jgi:hypothetical protein
MAQTDVDFRVVEIEHLRDGAARGIAAVAVDIAGVELTLHVTVRREKSSWVVEMPTFRYRGKRVDCVILPPDLVEAISREVYEVWMRDALVTGRAEKDKGGKSGDQRDPAAEPRPRLALPGNQAQTVPSLSTAGDGEIPRSDDLTSEHCVPRDLRRYRHFGRPGREACASLVASVFVEEHR